MPQKTVATTSGQRRIQVRRSSVHGRGVVALRKLVAGERIIEYTGEIISWPEAEKRHPQDPEQPNHTFYFHLDDEHVIDGGHGGNSSRWINHSCTPNCEAQDEDGRIWIFALHDIGVGQELNFDYGLTIDDPLTDELLAEYPCHCGSRHCRKTLLASTADGPIEPAGEPNQGVAP